ncbi:DUF2452 domain-containing protein [Desulfurivibrio alkaliphilus]|uniref:DUF2452 domain-containing protein n=1 Tax=Desulfurivibrio alkaliphilus (strain DSM 19089 / UNIQEM U267 / AHT2) TaxID=589865 RepID=D6Z616_DESAT|nr:DUF2452 domain-containing protein [Desulfurivibrio alkaliphilus]ADH84898.1 Protein of unknown function DUF2452 [Desulfurivibrio alkaliphilus AHT 2]
MNDDEKDKLPPAGSQKQSPTLYRGPDRRAPYPVSRMAPAFDLVDLARQIEDADRLIGTSVGGKLQVIAEQVRQLRRQAHEILDNARRDQELHRARCNFRRLPGHTYHLYRRPDGESYFSMLAPEDWRDGPPHEYAGSWRLEADQSWTPMGQGDESGDSEEQQALLSALLEKR